MIKTCGIFIFNDRDEILLVHPNNHNSKHFSIPKGVLEKSDNNNTLLRALIELEEECNVKLYDYKDDIKYIGEIGYKNGYKILVAYKYYFKSDDLDYLFNDLKCISYFHNTKLNIDMLENDVVKWIKLSDIYTGIIQLHESQKTILDKILME